MRETMFDQLLHEAEQQPFSGWDFSYLHGRMVEGAPSWDYLARVRERLRAVPAALDMDTGGGEKLASLAPLPPGMVATEAYAPNVAIARARLGPLGGEVMAVPFAPANMDMAPGEGIGSLPFSDAAFPLVINRHGSYYPAEVHRLLSSGGAFITQQVGGEHDQELNALLGAPKDGVTWNATFAARQLEQAGLRIMDRREEFPETVFSDVGAVTYYLKAVPWQIPDFTIAGYRDRLAALHRRIDAEGGLRIKGHLFYIEAVKL